MGFQWSYSHEDLLPEELSQQHVLVMYMIPTPDQMSKVDKEAELKRAIEEKRKVASERDNVVKTKYEEESSSSSLMSMYIIESDRKGPKVSSAGLLLR